MGSCVKPVIEMRLILSYAWVNPTHIEPILGLAKPSLIPSFVGSNQADV